MATAVLACARRAAVEASAAALDFQHGCHSAHVRRQQQHVLCVGGSMALCGSAQCVLSLDRLRLGDSTATAAATATASPPCPLAPCTFLNPTTANPSAAAFPSLAAHHPFCREHYSVTSHRHLVSLLRYVES